MEGIGVGNEKGPNVEALSAGTKGAEVASSVDAETFGNERRGGGINCVRG